jgi:hypothetical protein
MSDETDRDLASRSQTGPIDVGPLRSTGHVPPLLSVALVGAVVGLLVGFGFGYRLGTIEPGPTPAAEHTPVSTDLQADSVSSRLERAFESAAPGGWAVCGLVQQVACHELVVAPVEMRVPASEYGQGWYSNPDLTRVAVNPAHLVLAVSMGQGAAAAWLTRVAPDGTFLEEVDLTPVNPGRGGTFYFDLGTLARGHYVIETDFAAMPPLDESPSLVQSYVVGFIVV